MPYLIYRNLNNGKWSIKDSKTELVIGYADSVIASGISFSISEAGRQRVIEQKTKNVHAYIVAECIHLVTNYTPRNGAIQLSDTLGIPPTNQRQISYNPYKYPMFYYKDSGDAIQHDTKFNYVNLGTDGIVHVGNELNKE